MPVLSLQNSFSVEGFAAGSDLVNWSPRPATRLVQMMNNMRSDWAEMGGGSYTTRISFTTVTPGRDDRLTVTFTQDRPVDCPPFFNDDQIDMLVDTYEEGQANSENHPREYRDGMRAVLRRLGYRV